MRSGATNGYILVGDANGVMTWTDPTTITTAGGADADWTITGPDLQSTPTGNVGIGMAAGTHKLEVAGNTLTRGVDPFTATGQQAIAYLGDLNHGIRSEHTDGVTLFTRSITDGVKLEELTGHVGLGVPDPLSRLQLSNNIATFPIDDYNEYQILIYETGTVGRSYGMGVFGNSMWFNSDDAYRFISDGVNENMTILGNGNVGIGEDAPTNALDLGYADRGITVRAGNDITNFGRNQLLFGWDGSTDYRHAIKTRHGFLVDQNAIDFYLWNFGVDNPGDVGTQHVMSLEDGQVGIAGVTDPTQTLDIDGSVLLRSGNTGAAFTSNQILLGFQSGTNFKHAIKSRHNSAAQNENAIDFYVWHQGTDLNGDVGTLHNMSLNGGRVGIAGVTDPTNELDVDGQIRMRTGATNGYILVGDANGVMTWTDPSTVLGGGDGDWTINGNDQYSAVTGNVGIGTTTPTAKLQIGNNSATLPIDNYTEYQVLLYQNGINPENGYGFGVSPSTLWYNSDAAHRFLTDGDTENFTILANGNVGIGDVTPDHKLDVVGNGLIEGTQGFNLINETATLFLGDNNHGISSTFDAGVKLFTSGVTDGIVLRETSGFVGLNEPDPRSPLHMINNVATLPVDNFDEYQLLLFEGADAESSYGLGIASGALWFNTNDDMRFLNDGVNENMTILANGNVGMGETTPNARLHLLDDVTANTALLLENTNVVGGIELETQGLSPGEGILNIGLHTDRGIPQKGTNPPGGWMRVDTRGTGGIGFFWKAAGTGTETEIVTMISNGRVGIGTPNPDAPLDVRNSVTSTETYSFLNGGGTGGPGTFTNDYSIRASNAVLASEFNAFSDIRIKNINSRVSAEDALNTIMALRPTHYSYIDSIQNGTRQKTGFIAQEVKAVVPEAVTDNQQRFIPDVYALANEVSYNETSGQLTVRLPRAHQLLAGDSIKCITPGGEATAIVAAVGDDNTLMLDNWAGGSAADKLESLFVFGKWVTDFHTVDYDHLYTLGIGAIQSLQQQLAETNDKLEAEHRLNKDQESRIQRL